MTEYFPETWVAIEFIDRDDKFFKIVGGWSGSYLYGSSWRMNSGVDRVVDNGDFFEFCGHSGSVYICTKSSYRLSLQTANVFESLKKQSLESLKTMKPVYIRLLDSNEATNIDFWNKNLKNDVIREQK